MRFVALGAVAAGLIVCPVAVQANPASAIRTQAGSPIRVTACSASTSHTRGDSLHLSVTFTNVSSKDAAAVLVEFELQDQFGDVLGRVSTQATGEFSPGISIENQHWDGEDDWPGFSMLVCSVNRILFKDGTIWRSDASQVSPQS